MRKLLLSFTAFIVLMTLSGCGKATKNLSSASDKVYKKSLSHAYTKKEYEKLFTKYVEENKSKDLLWNYEAGTISYLIAKYPESIEFFDNAESLIKKYDEEVLAGKLLANIGSLLTNDTIMDYRPKIYEKIMVNTYKGIDFMLQKDWQNARIEFNRALVRQQRAKAFFAKEISQEKEKLKKDSKKKKEQAELANKALQNKKTMDPIEKKYSNLFAFKPYPDFVNPFTTYLAGIYFLNIQDYRKATDLLKECYGMIRGLNNGDRYVLQDFKMADNLKQSIRNRKRKFTWIVFLNGQAPIKKEIRIDIPLFLFSDDVIYTGIALPTLKMRNKAYEYLLVSNGKANLPTKTIASMDTVIKTEFKKRFQTIVTRAMLRTITQTVIQKQLKDKAGFLGGLFGAIYQAAMNKADTRMWQSLPKEFQVARLASSKQVTLYSPTQKRLASIHTDPTKSYIIFISMPTPNSEPIMHITAF